MEHKNLIFSDEARQKLSKGIQKLAQAVSVTMGPAGKNVLIQKEYKTVLTKDGVSVAREVHLEDIVENMGASLVKEVAQNTEKDAGDGTTTATVLANAIFQEGLRNITAGANPHHIKKGMDICIEQILENLKAISKEVTTTLETEQVATISANGDNTIGKMISEAIEKVGQDGIITVEEAKGMKDELEVVMGMQIPRGYLSPYFINDTSKLSVNLENTRVLLMNSKIIHLKDILPALSLVQERKESLLIICEDIEADALNTLVLNKMRKIIDVVVVKSPGYADTRKAYLEDIGALVGATVINPQADVKLTDAKNQLGLCDKVEVLKHTCTIIGGRGSEEGLQARIEIIKDNLEKETDGEHFKSVIKERLAKLTGGIAVIKVSAPSETELKERRDRVDDALGATRAAQEEGIIIGGGCALIKASFPISKLKLKGDEKIGAEIILSAIFAPTSQIAENAGFNSGVVTDTVKKAKVDIGFDASTGKYVDMFDAGIIDSLKVCRVALTNAVSVSSMLLTTECIISKSEKV
jgi:chaperonin GroEL